jgi:tRNA A37 threonylcarbamoyltransferase TsaD
MIELISVSSASQAATASVIHPPQWRPALHPHRADVAASFQEAAISVLVGKTKKALETFAGQSLSVAGGVAANTYLRSRLRDIAHDIDIPFFVPSGIFNTDNAAMIAAAGYINFLQKKSHPLHADGNLLF